MDRLVRLLENITKDARLALRSLSKSPGFTAVAVLSITLGIGANTAIFSLIDAVMWRMLPVKDPEGLQLLVHGQGTKFEPGVTYAQFRLMRDKNQVLESLAAYSPLRLNVTVDGAAEPTVDGLLVSGNYFPVLGIRPPIGRTIAAEDDLVPNGHRVAMISHGYWKRRFALDPGIVGRTIALSGTPFTIIGVTPSEFFGMEVGTAPDIFVPVMMQPTVDPSSENLLQNPILYSNWLRAFGRIKPGIPMAQATAELETLFRQEIPKGFGKFRGLDNERLRLQPAATGFSDLRRQFSQPLFILMAIVALVLLIACANTANLLLARAASRQAEFAMRFSLGGSRWRLIQQLLVESVVLALLGGICGMLLARWATRLLIIYISSGRTPVVIDLNPNLRVLAFTAAVAIGTGILFGLAPAMGVTRIDLASALKNLGGAKARGRGRLRPGRILAVVQVALSLMLLAGAGLFVRSLQNLNGGERQSQDSVLIVRVEPKGSDQRNIPGSYPRLDRIYKDLLERVGSIPGVRSASLAQFTPTNRRGLMITVRTTSGEEKPVFMPMVYGNYFKTVGIPIVAGRDFSAGDLVENAPPVVVVNETFAHSVYPNESAIGKPCLTPNRPQLPCQIIGVVKDTRYANLKADPPPTAFSPFLQTPTGRGQMALHVRVAGDPNSSLRWIREEVQRVDKDLPTFEIHTLAQEIDAALVQERLMATLSSSFSSLALLLAGVGLYGLLAFTVLQRTGEVGIRMALGATRGDVLWMVLREALLLVSMGVAIGVPVALAAARFASSQVAGLFFGLNAMDPRPIAIAVVILTLVAALAGYVPARRASRVDPMVALRNE